MFVVIWPYVIELTRRERNLSEEQRERAKNVAKTIEDLKILEALSATGLFVRYVKEIPNVGLMVMISLKKRPIHEAY